ncbi:leucine-rich repeat protein [Tanacetum coccineum]
MLEQEESSTYPDNTLTVDMSWISGLSLLKYLDLSNVDLSKAQNRDMVFYLIPSLEMLSLSGCGLTNADLSTLSNSSTTRANIKQLDLSHNHFKDNMLNSSVPIMPLEMCHLKELTVSLEIWSSYHTLRILRILESRDSRLHLDRSLKAAFPADSLGRMTNLRGLSLSDNELTRPIPESLKRLRFLEELDLSDNQLTGPVPTFIGELTQLVLSGNHLNGSIPESFGSLTALTHLDLSVNLLTGPIPTSLGRLVSLQLFSMYSNSLNETVLVSIGQLTKLRDLDISENSLEGVITEDQFAKLSMLKYLDTSFNRPLLTWLRKMPVIDFLDLSHNKLNGFLTNLPNKGYAVALIESSRALLLQDNVFNESILISLCIRIDLEYLDLSRNRLTRRIPECLGILDVAHNNLMGPIPHCLGYLNGMVTRNSSTSEMDGLSEENLIQVIKGVSLEYTTTFKYVINMDLSSNKLVGEIPVELMSLFVLVGLNLSNNCLIGSIPDSIGNKKALNSLDFSGNQLTGPIPPRNQLQTLKDPSIYVGNRDLCGAPLPKDCSNNEDQTTMHKNNKAANHNSNKVWFYMDIMCGFATGFWGVIRVLLLKKYWIHKLFMFAEETVDKIYVAVMLKIDKMKRGRGST